MARFRDVEIPALNGWTAQFCEDAPAWNEALDSLAGRVFLDTETTGYTHNRRLRLIQLGDSAKSHVWLMPPSAAPRVIEELAARVVVAHFLAFDVWSLTRSYALTAPEAREFVDTMIDKAARGSAVCMATLTHIHTGGSAPKAQRELAELSGVDDALSHKLTQLAERRGYPKTHWSYWTSDDDTWLAYGAWDIVQLAHVYADNEWILLDTGLNSVAQAETAVDIMYHAMAARGIRIDLRAAIRLEGVLRPLASRIAATAQDMGLANPNSPKQVVDALERAGAELTARTPTGVLSASAGVLGAIAEPPRAVAVARTVLEARRVAKMIGMVSSLVDFGSATGRIHPELRRVGARTGRSSCRTPNLQQIEKRSGDTRIRSLFLPEHGEVIVSSDYHNIEVRAIADLAGDDGLKQRLRDGGDIHGELARDVFGASYTPEERGRAKVGIFAMLYGASDSSIAAQTGMSVHQAEGLRGAWAEHYPLVAEASESWARHSDEYHCTVLPNGWVIEADTDDDGAPRAYQAVNHMIQGYAAFIFRQGALQLFEAGLWHLVRMVIHDEFLLSVVDPDEVREEFLAAGRVVSEGMEYPLDWTVHGASWGG